MVKQQASAPRQFADIMAVLSPFASSKQGSYAAALDWQQAYEFCSFHGVRPIFSHMLDNGSDAFSCPGWLRGELAGFGKAHAFAIMSKTAEILSLARALEVRGITAIFFKGAVLAEQVYGGSHLREFNDIDLLVDAKQSESATEALLALGYRPIITDQRFRRAFYDYQGQHAFRHEETGSIVDLHWSFVGGLPFPISEKEALESRVGLSLGGTIVPVPGRESLALILAGHGQKEGWASFSWVLDFAYFAAAFPDFDWGQAARHAKSRDSLRSLLTATLLVDTLFGHEIDPFLVTEARRDEGSVKNVRRAIEKYASGQRRKRADDLWGGLRLCETLMQRAKVILNLMTTRTIGDYQAWPMPPRWWWLYRFTRPFRLIWQSIRKPLPAE